MKKQQRIAAYEKYNGHCAYCGEEIPYEKMQVDHIRPAVDLRLSKQYARHARRMGEKTNRGIYYMDIAERMKKRVIKEFGNLKNVDAPENLLPACFECNNYKHAMELEHFREFMKTLHLRMKYKSRMKLELFRKYRVSEGIPWDGKFYFEKEKK